MMADNPLSPLDRARLFAEASFIAATPPVGATPVADAFVSNHPAVGIVRSLQDMVEADADARHDGEESVEDEVAEPEASDVTDPPEGYLDHFDASDIEWESPFVGFLEADTNVGDADDTADADADSNADFSSDAGESDS